MEPRRLLDADPVIAGITYLEGDLGSDSTPDYFEVTFEGGSPTTLLTQFVINGDQDQSGTLTDGDMFFDIGPLLPGAGGYSPFAFDAARSSGIGAADILGVDVSSDGLQMTVTVQNFHAGDKLVFSVDVDEVERFKVDKIASGVEFEASFFQATFVDPHYNFVPETVSLDVTLEGGFVQPQQQGIFYDEFDQLFDHASNIAGGTLSLPHDNHGEQSDRSAGAIDAYRLEPKPIVISGHVYHDENINCIQDAEEHGIPQVTITLQKLGTGGQYQDMAITQTDSSGFYEFGSDLKLMPGTYRLVEGQPDGYLSVGASRGTITSATPKLPNPALIAPTDPDVIADIHIPLGGSLAEDFDFKEVKPATISGSVYHDRNNDGIRDANEEGIVNVLIQVQRMGPKETLLKDPFENFVPVFIRTDINGNYSVDGLPPGIYQVTEINNYPPQLNPLAGYVDGKDTAGRVSGKTTGVASNDLINQILLCADEEGVQYNFGELRPASLSGYVSVTTPEGDCLDPANPSHLGIEGVTIRLFDKSGELVASTQTDENGFYRFDDLAPGSYTIVEVQPDHYIDGPDQLGTVNGDPRGISDVNDRFAQVNVGSGEAGLNYNFCEHQPALLSGHVWHDLDDDGVREAGELGIANVRIQLFNQSGEKIDEVQTDHNGYYEFRDLTHGTYTIREVHPVAYVDGKESLGSVDGIHRGTQANDVFRQVQLLTGQRGENYDFGEILLGSIAGKVHGSTDGDCVYEPAGGDHPLAGVTIILFDSNGEVARTTTGANGNYAFQGLRPGVYRVVEVQPGNYFDLGQTVGRDATTGDPGSGKINVANSIRNVQLTSGQQLIEYNFCEAAPAEIHGRVFQDGPAFENQQGLVPVDYRQQRDGTYQSSTDTPIAGVKMELWFYIDPQSGEISPRPVTLADVLPGQYTHLGTTDPSAPIWVKTDSNGQYRFTGLKAGNYIVLQQQPADYVDANDTPGSTTGFAFNSVASAAAAPQVLANSFSTERLMDSLANIRVNAGGISLENNFSEVVARPVNNPPLFPPDIPQRPINPGPPAPPPSPGWGLLGAQPLTQITILGGIGIPVTGEAYTWHLSVINAGSPREGDDAGSDRVAWMQAAYLNANDWTRFDMSEGHWSLVSSDNGQWESGLVQSAQYGPRNGIPVAGDFNGDGVDELAIFIDGYWLIDINGNRRWDVDDLLAKLGEDGDRPVTGDWDGDGKDDIGIYGPVWVGDDSAIRAEPGTPDVANRAPTVPKNIPPQASLAAEGARVMRLSNFGQSHADVIDHVFGYGDPDDQPVVGDWNGDGIRTIGYFRGGKWTIDANGDGRFDSRDAQFVFGRDGDLPLVGDFDGDGTDEVAVYRNGTFIIDINGNRHEEAADRVFQLGGAGDVPVVGDWNGDGIDDPAIYSGSDRL